MNALKLVLISYLFFIDTGQAADLIQNGDKLLRKFLYWKGHNTREEEKERNILKNKNGKVFIIVDRHPKSRGNKLLKLLQILKSEKINPQKHTEKIGKDIFINNVDNDNLNSCTTNDTNNEQKSVLRKRSACDKKASKFCIKACERATNNSCRHSYKCSKKKKRAFKKQCQVMCKGHFLYKRDSDSDSDDDDGDCD